MAERKFASKLRDNAVHDIYEEEVAKQGELARYLSKEYFYEKIKERTGLSIRTISYILNHTKKEIL